MIPARFKVVVPARYASTRLPAKPLLDLGGIYRFPVDWYESYRKNFGGVVTGPDCCSRRSMSFHYLVPREMLAFHSSLMSRTVDEQQFAQMVPESGFELLRFFLEHLEINA